MPPSPIGLSYAALGDKWALPSKASSVDATAFGRPRANTNPKKATMRFLSLCTEYGLLSYGFSSQQLSFCTY